LRHFQNNSLGDFSVKSKNDKDDEGWLIKFDLFPVKEIRITKLTISK